LTYIIAPIRLGWKGSAFLKAEGVYYTSCRRQVSNEGIGEKDTDLFIKPEIGI